MAEGPDPRAVAAQLRELASDPRLREVIAREHGCLPGLVLLLDRHEPQVVGNTLQALRYLAECVANRGRMRSELGLMVSLQNITDRDDFPTEVRSLATEVYELLSRWNGSADGPPTSPPPPGCADGEGEKEGECPPEGAGLGEATWGAVSGAPAAPPRRRRTRPFLGSTNKRAKTVTLHIDGLTDVERRARCEEVLLTVRGVISFTFQMPAQRCIVRMRADLKPECLATAIATTQLMAAQQVVKNEVGEEILVPLISCAGGSAPGVPDYLPEEDEDEGEATPREAVSRSGAPHGAGGGWLNTAVSFLSRSFYW